LRAELIAIADSMAATARPCGARGCARASQGSVLADSASDAETHLFEDGSGIACAQAVRRTWMRSSAPSTTSRWSGCSGSTICRSGERLALVAVGGYGRGTLAPGSDIDLLFVLPYKQTPLGEQLAEYILYMLWDMGLTVGHATRSIDECVRLSKRRYDDLHGDPRHALSLRRQGGCTRNWRSASTKRWCGTPRRAFIQAKLAERDARHKRMGETRYLVEPNIKDGKGGLRDLQTLFWIAKYFYRVSDRSDLVKKGVLSPLEYNLFVKCEDFLWAVRCHLHFLTGKAEERLGFEVQRSLADRLGYKSHPGLKDVERFMKHYFLIAKDVGDLTRIICAALEEEEVKQAPAFNRFLQTLPFARRTQKIPGTDGFHNREQAHQRGQRGRVRKGPGQHHPDVLVRRSRRARLPSGCAATDPPVAQADQQGAAHRSAGQPAVHGHPDIAQGSGAQSAGA
jgi:[protein-PII] uridylyltransferase